MATHIRTSTTVPQYPWSSQAEGLGLGQGWDQFAKNRNLSIDISNPKFILCFEARN